MVIHLFIHSFIPLACAEYDDSLLFSGAFSIPLCYVLFPAILLEHLLSLHGDVIFLCIYAVTKLLTEMKCQDLRFSQ